MQTFQRVFKTIGELVSGSYLLSADGGSKDTLSPLEQAAIYRKHGRYLQAARTRMRAFVDGKYPGDYTVPYEAGNDYRLARRYRLANKAFEKALDLCNDESRISVKEAQWYSLLEEGKRDLVKLEANLAEANEANIHSPIALRKQRYVLRAIYLCLHDKEGEERMSALLQDKHCPQCGSKEEVQQIIYGRCTNPPPDVFLAGCVLTTTSPWWYCQRDGLRF